MAPRPPLAHRDTHERAVFSSQHGRLAAPARVILWPGTRRTASTLSRTRVPFSARRALRGPSRSRLPMPRAGGGVINMPAWSGKPDQPIKPRIAVKT